jgi:hypothetical protein
MSEPLQVDEPGTRRAMEHVKSVLIASETLEAWAIQRRLFALKHRRMIVAATSGRLISITPRLIAGFELNDMRWQDLEEVTLSVGVFGADLMVRAGRVTDLAIEGASGVRRFQFEGLRKEQAQAVYRICQAQDQAWREKRRIRELDELRMRSGTVQVMAAAAPGGGGAAAPESIRRLQEAKQMLDAKLITDSEYEAIKARIVAPG